MTHRKGHIWTESKLDFLEAYLPAFQKACKKLWRDSHSSTCYVDGFAGPGKNVIGGSTRNGSPLVALAVTPPFERYFFVEKKVAEHRQLNQELSSPEYAVLKPRIDLRRGNFNAEIDDILGKIEPWRPTFFFLDPEGLELEWSTVEKIGQRAKADLFILVSGGGVLRASAQGLTLAHHETVTKFYGNEEWRTRLSGDAIDTSTPAGQKRFERAIELYVEGLNRLGFVHVDIFLLATNSRNADLHALVFASKNATANKIARHVIKTVNAKKKGNQPLLGFDI